nr:unnamed protein product [Digitaria exilis]
MAALRPCRPSGLVVGLGLGTSSLRPLGRASFHSLKTSRRRHAIGAHHQGPSGMDPEDRKRAESAALRFDNKQDEVSSCTTKQTLTMYVSIFVGLVKDAYDKKFNDESIFALLGAFRGVAAVGHILLQDTLAHFNYTEYSSSNYGVVLDSESVWCEFEQKMNNLEAKFRAVSKSTKAYEVGYL